MEKKVFTKNDRPEKIDGKFSIPYGYTEIEDVAFFRCGNLTSIEIPSSVTSIGRRAFGDCQMLSSIVIPDSVTRRAHNLHFEGTSIGIYSIERYQGRVIRPVVK